MATRGARRWSLGLLLVLMTAFAGADAGSAADESDQTPALPETLPLEPIEEPEYPAEQPAGSDCLDLLESAGQSSQYVDQCEVYPDGCEEAACYGEPCYAGCGRFWFRGDYLYWWTSGSRLPPLVTTNPTDVAPAVWGQSTALFGNERVHWHGRSAFRLTMGYWLACACGVGLETDYFDLGGQSSGLARASHGDPVLTRPYYDVQQGQQAVELIAYPAGVVQDLGTVGCVNARAWDHFASVGARVRYNLCCWELWLGSPPCGPDECGEAEWGVECGPGGCNRILRLDLIAGYRYCRLTDAVDVQENVVNTVDTPTVPAGTMFTVHDSFRASNEFNGGELGLIAELSRGRWSLGLLAKMALGNNHRVVTIDGSTAITRPGFATENHQGGLLALSTNIGRHVDDDFVVIPQFGAEIGYQITPRLRAYFGYDFLLWVDAARAGEQIDLVVDPRNIPPVQAGGTSRPAFRFDGSSFWAQGINVGFELNF